ncbi:MAG TPA: GlsB/YeaQ/YmgE family stress response membrane protein [Terriglobia bacterium]|nr:GlsB/YeaQ/YmgE family stress response membrane protein [Terriglobia bacterium]
MQLIWFLIIGLLAGWLAGHVMRGRGFGLLGDMVVGVVGAWLGRALLHVFGLYSVGFIGSLVTALIGAIILIALVRLIASS